MDRRARARGVVASGGCGSGRTKPFVSCRDGGRLDSIVVGKEADFSVSIDRHICGSPLYGSAWTLENPAQNVAKVLLGNHTSKPPAATRDPSQLNFRQKHTTGTTFLDPGTRTRALTHLLVFGVSDNLPFFLPKLGEVNAGRGLAAPPGVLQQQTTQRTSDVTERAEASGCRVDARNAAGRCFLEK